MLTSRPDRVTYGSGKKRFDRVGLPRSELTRFGLSRLGQPTSYGPIRVRSNVWVREWFTSQASSIDSNGSEFNLVQFYLWTAKFALSMKTQIKNPTNETDSGKNSATGQPNLQSSFRPRKPTTSRLDHIYPDH